MPDFLRARGDLDNLVAIAVPAKADAAAAIDRNAARRKTRIGLEALLPGPEREAKEKARGAVEPGPERIAKFLARAGLCSRRDAERWIAGGRVEVDGVVLTTPAATVTAASRVRVDGKPVAPPDQPRLFRYHKPKGLVTTHRDEKGRPTVFAALPQGLPRLVSVGRLDLASEGLLLLTNDGGVARRLELPATGWQRRYKVRVHGAVDPARLAALGDGVTVAGIRYGPIRAELERVQGSNAWIAVTLAEGKNRELRRVLETLGLAVTRLIRLSYGPFQLGRLAPGAIAEVSQKALAEQLGTAMPRWAQNANRRR